MTSIEPDLKIALPKIGSWPASVHQFDKIQVAAIEASALSGRPLLVRGEPGLGKSQVARAFAAIRKWRLVTTVINARTEVDDLLYLVDHVERIGDANLKLPKEELAVSNYIKQGPVWHALKLGENDPESEPKDKSDAGFYTPEHGCVLLIDEIDKARSDVPNALLEVLDGASFKVKETGEIVSATKNSVFFVITANDEKSLPAAFLRRCAVLSLTLGENPIQRLVEIALAHKEFNQFVKVDRKIFEEAAELVQLYRSNTLAGEYRPGSSEYIDLLTVIDKKLQNKSLKQADVSKSLEDMSAYLVRKEYLADSTL